MPLRIERHFGGIELSGYDSFLTAPIVASAGRWSQSGKLLLGNATLGTHPVVGDLFEWRARFDAVGRVAKRWIVNPSTNIANVFLHSIQSFLLEFLGLQQNSWVNPRK